MQRRQRCRPPVGHRIEQKAPRSSGVGGGLSRRSRLHQIRTIPAVRSLDHLHFLPVLRALQRHERLVHRAGAVRGPRELGEEVPEGHAKRHCRRRAPKSLNSPCADQNISGSASISPFHTVGKKPVCCGGGARQPSGKHFGAHVTPVESHVEAPGP
eukprot:scaffold498_cov348-Pinguiococcus_pyrenoidosus.AAC.5